MVDVYSDMIVFFGMDKVERTESVVLPQSVAKGDGEREDSSENTWALARFVADQFIATG